ncbi:late competence development ComFB family protein [Anaerovibrio sp. RM50]|uniref:late competence development ComFB family protein n=1 Tax=Anaerovibrio sp. RM50 TaxID=1200557 RepID=UPI000481155D|nr:competence protein ComFB [Anaerovibrio sp. RM50]
MVLKNYMEDCVLDKLNELIPQYPGRCFCENCMIDIANLALNHLPPKYVSTEKGQVFARVECFSRQSEVEIVKQIAAAIEKVETHPRH